MPVTLESAWRLSPSVALRPEPFGALAYHFGNRKLTFLKTPGLLSVVRMLGGQPSVAAAFASAGVPERDQVAYLGALQGLAASQMIEERL